MEGPTPVSALIHAATMVAAGVYMLCRVFFLLNLPQSHALEIIACVGGFTALLSALIAVQQDDIKRILAYSTLSQLGYMVMGVGLHGPTQAMFHLSTHAFFKALLFLGAGSIIYMLHHEQDIWKMGQLRKKMPITFWTFFTGTLALAGVWPLSGFFSKDSILAQTLASPNPALKYGLFAVGVTVTFLTAFYMFRLLLVVFFGPAKPKANNSINDSPQVMLWPLRILATLSVVGGVIGIEQLYARQFNHAAADHALSWLEQLKLPFVESPAAAICGLLAAALGFAAAYRLYARAASDPLPARLGGLSRAMKNRFYFDEIYAATVIRLHDFLAAIAAWLDRWIIGGLAVRGTHGTTEFAGRALRLLQTGNLQAYAFLFALGVALLLYFTL